MSELIAIVTKETNLTLISLIENLVAEQYGTPSYEKVRNDFVRMGVSETTAISVDILQVDTSSVEDVQELLEYITPPKNMFKRSGFFSRSVEDKIKEYEEKRKRASDAMHRLTINILKSRDATIEASWRVRKERQRLQEVLAKIEALDEEFESVSTELSKYDYDSTSHSEDVGYIFHQKWNDVRTLRLMGVQSFKSLELSESNFEVALQNLKRTQDLTLPALKTMLSVPVQETA